MPNLPAARPLLCAITNRRLLAGASLAEFVLACIEAGVDLVQIRERDVSARELTAWVREAVLKSSGTDTRIIVNDSLEAAVAGGAHGVQLPAQGLPLGPVRDRYPEMLIGISAHTVEDLRQADAGGASFALYAPVFAPLSKTGERPSTGIEGLRTAVESVNLPVLALGGITEQNAPECLQSGAAGVAGITLFQGSSDLAGTVRRLRQAGIL